MVHHVDPVPHLPLEDMGFKHMGTEVYYLGASNGTYQVCDSSGEDPTCSDGNLLDLNLMDHLDYLGVNLILTYLTCEF